MCPTFADAKQVYTVIAAVAELERELIRECVVMGLQRAKAQGKELLSKVVDGASGGDLILPDSVDEFHIFNDLSQAAVAL